MFSIHLIANLMLNKEIENFIAYLTQKCSSIAEIWLIGSRANGIAREDSDWDLLVFGGELVFKTIKNDTTLHNDNVDLLVVLGDRFVKPYGEPKEGSLQNWKWKTVSDVKATYEGKKWIADIEAEKEGFEDMGRLDVRELSAAKIYSM